MSSQENKLFLFQYQGGKNRMEFAIHEAGQDVRVWKEEAILYVSNELLPKAWKEKSGPHTHKVEKLFECGSHVYAIEPKVGLVQYIFLL